MNQDRFVMSDPVWKTYPIKPVMRMSASVKGCRMPAVDRRLRRLASVGRRQTSLKGGNRGRLDSVVRLARPMGI